MKESKLVKDVKTLIYMLGKDWKSYTIESFEGDRKNHLFNAYYNNDYREVSEYIVNKISDTIDRGRELFGIKIQESNCGNYIYMYKESKQKSVFMEFELK